MPDSLSSQVSRMADAFRQEIIDRERSVGSAMLSAYGHSWQVLKAQLEATLREIQERRDAGQDVSVGWLRRLDRLRNLKAQVESEVRRFAQYATSSTTTEQSVSVHAAQVHAASLIQVQKPGASVEFDRLHTRAIEHLVGFGTDGAPLRALFEEIAPGTADAAIQSLINGAVIGLPVAQMAEKLRDELGTGLSRALTIARTETLRAYRMSSIDSYQASPLVTGWYWRSYPSACGVCQAMSGTFHPVSEHFYSHPRCLPAGAVVEGPLALASTARWYVGEVLDIETVGGDRLTVTPNHPVLTSHGWIAAGLLNEGSDIICSSGSKSNSRGVPDDYQVPSFIENVAVSLSGSASVASVTVPTSAEDFHGDGAGSEVCVIRSDGLLRLGPNTTFPQPYLQKSLCRRHTELLSLSGLRPEALLPKGMLPHFGRGVSSFRVPPISFGRTGLHHQPVGIRGAAHGDPLPLDDYGNGSPLYAERLCKGLHGLAGGVSLTDKPLIESAGYLSASDGFGSVDGIPLGFGPEKPASLERIREALRRSVESGSNLLHTVSSNVRIDRVLKISVRQFSGHVYNLQTSAGWYIANGIVTHNCRCAPIPAVKGADLKVESGPERFAALPAAKQQEILGPAKFDLYRNHRIRLEDLVQHTHSERWGPGLQEANIRQALENANRAGNR